MHLFSKISLIISVLIASSYAVESFAGIGVALYKSSHGGTIAGIASNSPAAFSDLKVGDCIVSIDGVSVKDRNLIEIRNMIRSETTKPLSLGILRNGDSLVVDLKRMEMNVVNVTDSARAIEESCAKCELLGVVSTKEKKAAFFVRNTEKKTFPKINKSELLENVELKLFSRQKLKLKALSTAPMDVSLYTVDGFFVKRKKISSVQMGENLINWNNKTLPAGQYVVQIEQNEKKCRFIKPLN